MSKCKPGCECKKHPSNRKENRSKHEDRPYDYNSWLPPVPVYQGEYIGKHRA